VPQATAGSKLKKSDHYDLGHITFDCLNVTQAGCGKLAFLLCSIKRIIFAIKLPSHKNVR
jgi:hypothetical protein